MRWKSLSVNCYLTLLIFYVYAVWFLSTIFNLVFSFFFLHDVEFLRTILNLKSKRILYFVIFPIQLENLLRNCHHFKISNFKSHCNFIFLPLTILTEVQLWSLAFVFIEFQLSLCFLLFRKSYKLYRQNKKIDNLKDFFIIL